MQLSLLIEYRFLSKNVYVYHTLHLHVILCLLMEIPSTHKIHFSIYKPPYWNKWNFRFTATYSPIPWAFSISWTYFGMHSKVFILKVQICFTLLFETTLAHLYMQNKDLFISTFHLIQTRFSKACKKAHGIIISNHFKHFNLAIKCTIISLIMYELN